MKVQFFVCINYEDIIFIIENILIDIKIYLFVKTIFSETQKFIYSN
jgi:hypothetical protein